MHDILKLQIFLAKVSLHIYNNRYESTKDMKKHEKNKC